ncbi:MAG: SDR family oxidoreductase [Planctomycetes bacterium]|nr:SDR family oxidoreductase [Myxococcales bacterium]MCB9583120.1 SDR family oxidoreductase [Polyangiaceae bacterium]MCB9830814.1 SDR family oxidoreductase [Planctomycetota bacterium]
MSLVALLKGKGPSGFGYGSTAEEVTEGIDLGGRNVLVTGASSGLGLETVRVLALRGARVIAVARSEEKARGAIDAAHASGALPVACELAEPESVLSCVSAVEKDGVRLDAIICNAGIMALPKLEKVHGYEKQFFTNHIGHFLLVTRLLPRLAETGRVVMLSSSAHSGAPPEGIAFDNLQGEKSYSPWAAYGQSKLANLLFARELSRRLSSDKQTANAVHPGVIKTNLGRNMPAPARAALAIASPLVLKSEAQGAATQCYVAVHPDAASITGEYFADCNVSSSTRQGRDMDLAERLWEESERIIERVS